MEMPHQGGKFSDNYHIGSILIPSVTLEQFKLLTDKLSDKGLDTLVSPPDSPDKTVESGFWAESVRMGASQENAQSLTSYLASR